MLASLLGSRVITWSDLAANSKMEDKIKEAVEKAGAPSEVRGEGRRTTMEVLYYVIR